MSVDKPPASSCQQHCLPSLASTNAGAAAATGGKSPSSSSSTPQFAVGYDLNLPPSIPISLDGEEGAYAYSQQLLQINSETKPECYQPPPNITIRRRLSGDYDDVLGAPFHSSYASVESTHRSRSVGGQCMERQYMSDTESSLRFISPRKGTPLPEVPVRQPSREFSSSGDYVGSSLLSTWRSAASSELEAAALAPSRHHQARSSSADSVKRLAKLKRFLARKLGGRVSMLKQESLSSHSSEAESPIYDRLEGAKGLDKSSVGESPWDLPPNYVDMIFTRDPVTNDPKSDVVENISKLDIRKS